MSNTVSIEELKNVVSERFESSVEVNWHGLIFDVKKCLSLKEMLMFVRDVVSSCFLEDTNEYSPEIKDFALRCCVLEYYAGIVLPESIEEKYEIVYNSNLASFITRRIEETQFNAMLQAIDEKIEHLAQSNIEALNSKMTDVLSDFSTLEEKLSGVFENIDNETVSKIAGAIANGSFDERKLVEAFKENEQKLENKDGKVVQLPYKKA